MSKKRSDIQLERLKAQTNDLKDLPVWYEPREIVYHPVQMEKFCLPHIGDLSVGDYPSKPAAWRSYDIHSRTWRTFEQSGYKEYGGPGGIDQPNGYFVKAVEIAAEISARILSIGTVKVRLDGGLTVPVTGVLVYDVYQMQKEIKDNALILEAARMLLYISGWSRRPESYSEWRHSGQ